MKIINVVGARPNFMKIAPLIKELKKHRGIESILLHTGQHYDQGMSGSFFRDLNLPKPDIYLGVGSSSHGEQTGRIMVEFEKICFKKRPDLVVVVGDVNSTLACALVAAKLNIPVAHIEAGLRSFDRSMPEEINRLLTDQIADYLFTHCQEANDNLMKEGISRDKIFLVGNIMIDSLLSHLRKAKKSNILFKLGLGKNGKPKKYALLTLHRPSNVDDPDILKGILKALNKASKNINIIFPAHPRTIKQAETFGLKDLMNYIKDIRASQRRSKFRTIPSLGYFDFLCLMSNATLVLTDSGGVQEETTILGVPCLTLRHNTERAVTVRQGTNRVVGNDPQKIVKAMAEALKTESSSSQKPDFWDGKTAERIVKILLGKNV